MNPLALSPQNQQLHHFIKQIQHYFYDPKILLGRGTSSKVYLGKCSLTHRQVAVKVISTSTLNSSSLKNIQMEIQIHQKLPLHPNIAQLLGVFQTQNNIYLVTEYCSTTLKHLISNNKNNSSTPDSNDYYKTNTLFSYGAKINIIKGIASALQHLASHGIVHRDIKPDNIMIQVSHPSLNLIHSPYEYYSNQTTTFVSKIVDFGFARQTSPDHLMLEYLGTPLYMSPQLLQGSVYSSKCDIWSFGIVIYQIIFGLTPWYRSTRRELLNAIRVEPLFFANNQYPQIQRIIRGCLQYQEQQRWSWTDVFQAVGSLRDNCSRTQAMVISPHQPRRRSMHLIRYPQHDSNPIQSQQPRTNRFNSLSQHKAPQRKENTNSQPHSSQVLVVSKTVRVLCPSPSQVIPTDYQPRSPRTRLQSRTPSYFQRSQPKPRRKLISTQKEISPAPNYLQQRYIQYYA